MNLYFNCYLAIRILLMKSKKEDPCPGSLQNLESMFKRYSKEITQEETKLSSILKMKIKYFII